MEKKLTVKEALRIAVEMQKSGKVEKAQKIYQEILEVLPDNPDALHLYGLTFFQNGDAHKALELIEKAIKNRKEAVYYGNMAMIYDSLNMEEESAKNYLEALKINPNYEGAHLANYNLGIYFKDKGETGRALKHYNNAIRIKEDFYDAYFNRGLMFLIYGDLKEGFEGYEYRFKKANQTDSRIFSKPKWDGINLNGKRILIASGQGFGDSIQFIRYIPFVKESGGYVILECRKELIPLFKDFPGIDRIIEKDKTKVPDVEFNLYIYLMSLPRIFKTTLENIPHDVPYLSADREKFERFKEKFDKDKINVGIAWKGNKEQENDKNRSTTFEKFKILSSISNIQLYSLQIDSEEKIENENIIDLSNEIHDFSDTAALIENLDLIISVDTAIAHLAGAMNKPIWTLLTYLPDWRWLLERSDSPWYPSMKLFRQERRGDWDSLLEKVKSELENYGKK